MTQAFSIQLYYVPWGGTDARPIWTDKTKFDAFFEAAKIGDEKRRSFLDFNPRQETLIINKASGLDFEDIRRANLCRVRIYDRAIYTDGHLVDDLFYFITESTPRPLYQDNPDTPLQIGITLDAWTTYIAATLARGQYVSMASGTIIEQSHEIDGASVGANAENITGASYPFGDPVGVDFSGETFTAHAFGLNFGAHQSTEPAAAFEREFYFVGIFSRDGGGAPLCLCRPIELKTMETEEWETIGALLSVDRLKYAQITSRYISESTSGDAFNVNLTRAYLIPRKAFQRDSTTTATSGGQTFGYKIDHVVGGAATYSRNIAFAEVITDAPPVSFGGSIRVDPAGVLGDGNTYENTGKPVFVDFGTPFNRLQVKLPEGRNYARISANGHFSTAGYSLILHQENRQIDVGADFEIPATDNPTAEAFARNKWATALQGVSHVGGIAIAAATQNPVAFVGASISAGQFLANISTANADPATIQGQGNGETLRAWARGFSGADGYTFGAVFIRYVFPPKQYPDAARRFGWRWRGGAFVENKQHFGYAVFGNGTERPLENAPRGFLFIKTAGARLLFGKNSSFQLSPLTAATLIPEDYKRDLEEIFNKGVAIYYNPTAGTFGT